MDKKVENFNKDYYKNQIIATCNKIINKADYILEHYEDKVNSIKINISLEPLSLPTVTIIKEHIIVEGERYELV